MVNKCVSRSKVLTLIEIAFVGALAWVALSGILFSPNNSVQANQDEGKKHQKGERWIPEEGKPEPRSVKIAALSGTQTCTTFDFAGGATQGFTVTTQFGTPLALWHVTNSLCRAFLPGHSNPYDLYYGQDATCNYNTGARNASTATSPTVSLTGVFPPFTLSFNYLLFVEGGGFDTPFVDISTNGGATWTQVLSKGNFINDNQWHNIIADITSQVGAATAVQVRYRFDSIDNIANSTTGWHVDDISVCGANTNFCVQDDVTGDFVKFNSITGEYTTQQCSTGFTAGGTGKVTTVGNTVTLSESIGGRFNTITVNTATHTGSAKIRVAMGLKIVAYNINDSNTLNNTCSCP